VAQFKFATLPTSVSTLEFRCLQVARSEQSLKCEVVVGLSVRFKHRTIDKLFTYEYKKDGT